MRKLSIRNHSKLQILKSRHFRNFIKCNKQCNRLLIVYPTNFESTFSPLFLARQKQTKPTKEKQTNIKDT